MKSDNLKVISKYVSSAKERKNTYKENSEDLARYRLDEFCGGELKFTKSGHLTYRINSTDYYLEFNVDKEFFTLYINEPFLYLSSVQISGLEALGDAVLEVEEEVAKRETERKRRLDFMNAIVEEMKKRNE